MGMVIGTLEDYFENDLQGAMLDSYIRRFVSFKRGRGGGRGRREEELLLMYLIQAQSCLDKLIFRYLLSPLLFPLLSPLLPLPTLSLPSSRSPLSSSLSLNIPTRYAQEMLTKKHAFNRATVEKMTDDLAAVRDFFVKHVKPQYYDAQIKALEDLKELLDSYVPSLFLLLFSLSCLPFSFLHSSCYLPLLVLLIPSHREADMICLYFDSLLRNHAGVTLRVVEIVLPQREDLSKSEQKEAILGCKDILDKFAPDTNNPPKEGNTTLLLSLSPFIISDC